MTHRIVLIVVLAAIVSACAQLGENGRVDILSAGKPVSIGVSQSLALSQMTNNGFDASTIDAVSLYTLRAVDFLGEPFIDITISAPVSARDFWDLASGVAGDEWAPNDTKSGWGTVLTGASTARDPIVVANVGLALPMRLVATVSALGGLTNVDEVIAVEQQTFVILDTKGQHWDVQTQSILTAARIRELTIIYQDMVEANDRRKVLDSLTAKWGAIFPNLEAMTLGSETGIVLDQVLREDGTVDTDALAAKTTIMSATNVNPIQRTCVLFFCNELRTGYIPSSSQALLDGGPQDPATMGWDVPHQFSMPYCITTSSVNTSAPVGCGPAAFVGVIQRLFIQGEDFLDLEYNGTSGLPYGSYDEDEKVRELGRELTAPLGLHGRPLIANYMGTCWNTGGSMTIGAGYRDGAKAFLLAEGKSHTVKSNISHYSGNVTSAPAKAQILIRNIGNNNNPVVAEYFRGVTDGHFSPVTQYAVYDSGSNGLNVMTMTDGFEWYSLSGTWGTERGVFAIE